MDWTEMRATLLNAAERYHSTAFNFYIMQRGHYANERMRRMAREGQAEQEAHMHRLLELADFFA